MMTKKTAILLFNRSAHEEAKAKGYFSEKSATKAVKLIQYLKDQTYQTAQRINLPVLNFDSKKQKGDNFGARITHAIKSSFEKGYDNLIIIGIDSPGLNYRHIHKAKSILETSEKTILGPSHDGGVYLIGINKSNFCEAEFLNLAWQTEELQQSWKKVDSDIEWLNPLTDIDQLEDLFEFLPKFDITLTQFHKLISIILKVFKQIYLPLKIDLLRSISILSFGFRAPPQLA